MCALTSADPTDNESVVKITFPSDSSLVNIKETVTGTAQNIPEGQKLWILVYSVTANKFYPQSGNVNIINGEWLLTVGLGTKENIGETFKIIAVLADQESNEELMNYIYTGPSTGWPGMSSIPVGAKIVDEVTVTRINPEINITYPSNTTSVNTQEIVNGTAKNIPSEHKVWILVHPLATTKLYPQHGNVNIINEKWSIQAELGGKENVGETFEIIAVLANENAHEELTNYINTGRNTDSWPGIDNIPDGADVYDEVTVTRTIEPMVKIISPLDTAKIRDTITGTAKYIPEDKAVWILIYPQTANKYYPQNKADIQNEKWVIQAQFGLEENDSEYFDIIAVLADQNAQNEFTVYRDKSNAAQKWDGIQTLPNTTQELDRVTVTRVEDLPPAEDTGSGGGSGGSSKSSGGGGSPEPARNVDVKELAQVLFITNGKPVKFEFAKNATCVVCVGFDAVRNAGKTTTIVEQLKGKSSLVSELPEGEVYKSFNVWVGNAGYATSKNIENPVLCFKVEKTWLQSESDKDLITLSRYSNKTWEEIPVIRSGDDSRYLYFTASVPGFSSFAITGKTNNLSTGPTEDETPTGNIPQEETKKDGSGVGENSNSKNETDESETPIGDNPEEGGTNIIIKILLFLGGVFLLIIVFYIIYTMNDSDTQ